MLRAEGLTAGANPGSVEWAFYDERFDAELFEIWSLVRLVDALEAALGKPAQAASSLLGRTKAPIRSWHLGGVRVQLYFQPALSRLTRAGTRWRFRGVCRRFG